MRPADKVYSKWTEGSAWLTYWGFTSGKTRGSQVFAACLVGKATYDELSADFQGVIDRLAPRSRCPKRDRDELAIYARTWMDDVERQSP